MGCVQECEIGVVREREKKKKKKKKKTRRRGRRSSEILATSCVKDLM